MNGGHGGGPPHSDPSSWDSDAVAPARHGLRRPRRRCVTATALARRNGPPAQLARGLRPLGTPVGPVRVVKITMALVAESTERALSEVEQGSAQGLLAYSDSESAVPRSRPEVTVTLCVARVAASGFALLPIRVASREGRTSITSFVTPHWGKSQTSQHSGRAARTRRRSTDTTAVTYPRFPQIQKKARFCKHSSSKCQDVERAARGSARAARSVIARSCATTSRASPSPPSAVSRVVAA